MARVMQNSQAMAEMPERNQTHNLFDLSHDHKTTFSMGQLIPFLTVMTYPSDKFMIRGDFMMRFAPLYLPIMHKVNMRVDYFYVPNRITWPGQGVNTWEGFITTFDQATVPPYVTLVTFGIVGGLHTYMGFPTKITATGGDITFYPINAIQFGAYLKIYDEFFRNPQVQAQRWFALTTGDNSAAMATALNGLLPLRRNWPRDYYTSATPTPQEGEAVQIPLINFDNIIDNGFDPPHNMPTDWFFQPGLGSGGTPAGGSLNLEPTTTAGIYYTSEDAAGNPVGLNIQETAATIAQLRFNIILQEYAERQLRAGDRYDDNTYTFFGIHPDAGTIHRPIWLGGKSGTVVISEVLSTAETATLKVGNYAGQALSLESTNDTIRYTCSEWGFIIGLITVYPKASYFQGIDRMWGMGSRSDYTWEQFSGVGDQAIKNKEVNFSYLVADADWNEEEFGYTGRFNHDRYKNDIISGQMRTTFISFHLGRLFDTVTPSNTQLDDEFLQCAPDVLRVFQVAEGEDEIYAHIYNDVKVLRRLPKFGMPQV